MSVTAILILVASVGYGFLVAYGRKKRREAVRQATLRDYAIAGLILVGLIGTYFHLNESFKATTREMVREQFVLSDDIETVKIEFIRRGPKGASHTIRATYRFTDEQLRAYRATFPNAEVWKPHAMEHNGHRFVGEYTHRARRWTHFPGPLKVADLNGRTVNDLPWLRSLWWAKGESAPKNGRVMCFLFQDVKDGPRTWTGRSKLHTVSACSEVAKSEWKRAYVMGVLDFDTNTLSVTVE